MQRNCSICGRPFEAQRSTAKYCGSTCRANASMGAKPARTPAKKAISAPIGPDSLEAATLAHLQEVERADSVLGVQAVSLARLIESPSTMPSAVAALSREFREVMKAAMEGVAAQADPLDELRARRERRLNAG